MLRRSAPSPTREPQYRRLSAPRPANRAPSKPPRCAKPRPARRPARTVKTPSNKPCLGTPTPKPARRGTCLRELAHVPPDRLRPSQSLGLRLATNRCHTPRATSRASTGFDKDAARLAATPTPPLQCKEIGRPPEPINTVPRTTPAFQLDRGHRTTTASDRRPTGAAAPNRDRAEHKTPMRRPVSLQTA